MERSRNTGRQYSPMGMRSAPQRKQKPHKRRRWLLPLVVIVLLGLGGWYYSVKANSSTKPSSHKTSKTVAAKTVSQPINYCAGNTLTQLILVSISKRHLWACDGQTVMYSSAVVTGIDYLAADLTPTGTYHIFGKETNLYLTGHDSTGSWDDFVHYWMPFLTNKYGTYGLHDATWRQPSAFGKIAPNSANGSHGCVELPLATAKWLYAWDKIGTTVTIES